MKKKWYLKTINGKDFIYHCFTFDPKIQEHTFLGESFIGMDQVDETRDLKIFDRVVAAGFDGFMPQLVEEIKNVFGGDNYSYDGYEIGEDEFSLYFFIEQKSYTSLLKKIELWAEYNEIRHLMSWYEKD